MGCNGLHEALRHGADNLSSVIAGVAPRNTAWRVIHACEYARDVLPLVEGQVAAGLRPYIVTPQGAGSAEVYLAGSKQEQPRSLSLLRSWQDVRNWRKSILECEPETSADVVHAHSFAAGMAGVRSTSCVVYDLPACIEELATSARLCEIGSWMARSFRVAEQFVLSRAAAVAVHSLGMKQAALERGAPPGSTFLIPDPLPYDDDDRPSIPVPLGANFLQQRYGLHPGEVALFAPEYVRGEGSELAPQSAALLRAFALAAAEIAEFKLLLTVPDELRTAITELSISLGIMERICITDAQDSTTLLQFADIVLAAGEPPPDMVEARMPNRVCLQALYHGRPLLAADILRNRDASPEGRGCLWFEADNPRDLAHRMAFLGRHPEFRAALGCAGQALIAETRSPAVVGEKYKEVYRHAAARRRFTGTGLATASPLEPAANWS